MRWLFLALVALSLLLLDSRALAQEDVPVEEAVGSGSAESVDEASPLTEEEKQKLQSLWVAYIQRYLTQPCLVQLQGLMTAKEEERDALNAAFQGMCDDEMKKLDGEFRAKVAQGLTPKQILGPERKRERASRTPRPSKTPKPFKFELPAITMTPELSIALQVVALFVLPILGAAAYFFCLGGGSKGVKEHQP